MSMGMRRNQHQFEVMQTSRSKKTMCFAAGHCIAAAAKVVAEADAVVPYSFPAQMVAAQAVVVGIVTHPAFVFVGAVAAVVAEAGGAAGISAAVFAGIFVVGFAAAAGEDRPKEDVSIDSGCHSISAGAAAAETVVEPDLHLVFAAAVVAGIAHC